MALDQTKVIQRRIVFLAVFGVILTCILTISFLSIPFYLDSKKSIQQELLLHSYNKSLEIEHLLFRIKQNSKSISGRIHARHLVAQYNRGEVSLEYVKNNSVDILSEAIQQVPDILGVIRIARNGDILLRAGQDLSDDIFNPDIVSAELKDTRIGKIVSLNNKTNALIVYSPILGHKGHFLGIDVVAFHIDKFEKIVQPTKLYSALVSTVLYSKMVVHVLTFRG